MADFHSQPVSRDAIAQALLDRFIERGSVRFGGSTFPPGTKIQTLVRSYRDDFYADADAILALPSYGVQNSDAEKALRDEIWQLREIIKGVRIMANAGAFSSFDGEPWLRRVQNIDLYSDPVAVAEAFASSVPSADRGSK